MRSAAAELQVEAPPNDFLRLSGSPLWPLSLVRASQSASLLDSISTTILRPSEHRRAGHVAMIGNGREGCGRMALQWLRARPRAAREILDRGGFATGPTN